MRAILLVLALLSVLAACAFATFAGLSTATEAPRPPCRVPGAIVRYVIADLLSAAEIRREPDGGIIAASRNTYALWMNPASSKRDDFIEWYEVTKFPSPSVATTREIRNGNWPQGDLTDSRRYPIAYQGASGQLTLVYTGADYSMPWPIPARPLYSLDENVDFWSYDNSDNDTICQQSFFVTSRDFRLRFVRAVERHVDGGVIEIDDGGVMLTTKTPEGATEYSIVVRWTAPLAPQASRRVEYEVLPIP